MKNMLNKEIRLTASVLTWCFIAFGLMAFLPGYPILCGAFFISFGIFQSFQSTREQNDILYSILLPVAKADIVRAKYCFAALIQGCGFVVMAACTLVRMTVLSESATYRANALMNANPFFLGLALVIFGLFNLVFIGGFFKTAYKFAKPFIAFIVSAFAVIMAGEILHHIPGLGALNAFGFDELPLQLGLMVAGAVLYAGMTLLSCKAAIRRFEKIDL